MKALHTHKYKSYGYQCKQQINLLLGSFIQQLHKEAISFITAVYPPTQNYQWMNFHEILYQGFIINICKQPNSG
jgi:hypothetical protein